MITLNEYIRTILKKKGWTLKQFADEINHIKEGANLKGKISPQNICNFLNQVDDKHILRPKQLCIWEVALDLPYDSLCNMVAPPKTKEAKKELEELKKRVRK